MNQNEQDLMLRKLLLDALEYEWKDALETAPEASLSHKQIKRMHALLQSPISYAKRMLKPKWKRVCERVAIVFLAFLLSFGALYASSSTVRAAVNRWLMELTEIEIIYRFFGENTDTELPMYVITELPEGYTLSEEPFEMTDYRQLVYARENGESIRLEYTFMEKGQALFIDTTNMIVSDISVNNCSGQIFFSNDASRGTLLLWTNDEIGIQFCIDARVDKDTLLSLANSVRISYDRP